jgi:hypothetical protein
MQLFRANKAIKFFAVGRTLLSAAFEVDFGSSYFAAKAKIQVKTGGQECPLYTVQHPGKLAARS